MKNLFTTGLLLVLGSIALTAQFDGTIDSTFADNGVFFYDYNDLDFDDVARVTRIGDDGKIYMGGYVDGQNRNILLVRLHPDGTLDNTFGSNGTITYDPLLGGDDELLDLIVADGKVTIFGSTTGADPNQIVARFNEDGTPDTSFNGTGSLITGGAYWDMWTCGLIDQNGKIMMAGLVSSAEGQDLAIGRINADGTPDLQFGFNGLVVLDFAEFEGFIDIYQAAGNRFYLSAIGDNGSSIIAIDNNGDLINDFDSDGRKMINPDPNEAETIYQIFSDDANALYLIGESIDAGQEADLLVAKMFPNGTYDTGFGIDGFYKADLASGEDDFAVAGHLTENGSLLLGGFTAKSGNGNLATIMLASDGLLDAGYGTLGVMEYDVAANSEEFVAGMTTDADGHVYIYGTSDATGNNDLVLVRLKGEAAMTATQELSSLVQTPAIYPQPAGEELFISFELKTDTELDLEIMDMNGRVVSQWSAGYQSAGQQTIDLSNMLPQHVTGMYLLRLKTKQGAMTLPISLL